MEILFFLFATLAFNWFAGFVVVVLLQSASLYRIRAIRLTLPVVGYATSNLVWWAGTFVLKLSTGTVISISAGIALAAVWLLARLRFSHRRLWPLLPAKCDWPLVFVMLTVVGFSAWPYMSVGMGNYFLVNETDYFVRVIPSVLVHHQISPEILYAAAGSKTRMLRDLFPLQLSSLTLLQRLLGCTSTDAAALQAIIDLVFTAIGVYWLSRYVFRFRVSPAIAAGVFSVVSQFYYHTYLDGHLGSLMYVSVAPVLFGLCVLALCFDRYRTTVPVIAVLCLFMSSAYPLVLYLLFPSLMLAKARLLYLGHRKAISALILRVAAVLHLPPRALSLLATIAVLVGALPTYGLVRSLFYPNRVSLIFNGYQPMSMVFDRHVLQWFFGLRITQGFGYGFVEPGPNRFVDSYNVLSIVFIAALLVSVAIAGWQYTRITSGSFLSAFLLTFPPISIAFAWFWPFSYLIYKFLYVHYFLIVVAVLAGAHALIRMRWRLLGWTLFVAVAIAAGINVFGTSRTAAVALNQVREVDLADLNSLVWQLRAAGITRVSLGTSTGLSSSVISYGLHQAGLSADKAAAAGQPVLTDQRSAITPVAEADIVMRSAKGKYVLSNVPALVEAYGGSATTVEVRRGLPFVWINTSYDYNARQFAKYFDGVERFLKSVSPTPVVFNDLSDGGYYALVQALLDRSGVPHSEDPRACSYFLRLNGRIANIAATLEGRNSAVVVRVDVESGKRKIVPSTYRDDGRQRIVWSNDLFEVVLIPLDYREVSAPEGLDVRSLIDVIRKDNLTVADGISPFEHERLYLEDRLAAAGIRTVPSRKAATSVLLCIPNAILERNSRNGRSILWRASTSFSQTQGYDVVMLDRETADRVTEDEAQDPVWSARRPLRTLLWRIKDEPELVVKARQPDRELRLLFETGPSLMESGIVIRALRADGLRTPMSFRVASPSQIIQIPVDHFALPGEGTVELTIESDLHLGKPLMPYDDRFLLYRLLGCELASKTDPLYSRSFERKLRIGAMDKDIVESVPSAVVALGTGWFQRELANGVPFRWMSDGADIVLERTNTNPKRLRIIGEVGPSAPSGKLSITTRINGVALTSQTVDGRAGRVMIDVDCNSSVAQRVFRNGQNVVSLSTSGGGLTTPGDPRVLNFRVFQIRLEDHVTPN
jgi:hypothetical protein